MGEEKTLQVVQVLGRMDRGGAETMVMNLYRKIDRTKVQFVFVVHNKIKILILKSEFNC